MAGSIRSTDRDGDIKNGRLCKDVTLVFTQMEFR